MFRTLSWLLALSASVCDHCGCTGCREQCEHHALLRVHAGISIVAWLRCVLAFARLFPFSRVCARAFLTAVIFPGSVSDGPAAADDLHIVEDHVDLFDVLQRGQFDRYYQLLTEWNKVMNLTGITEYDEVVLKHFSDSLSIVRILDMSSVKSLIDVGTGAGFPGIPLKIVFPQIKVVLLDSLNKRIKFLDTVIDELKLKNISAVHGVSPS